METENMINVTDVPLEELAKAAYSLSVPVGMGMLHFVEGELSDQDAKELVDSYALNTRIALSMDYVKGRCCKFHVRRNKEDSTLWIDDKWYDHSDGQLQKLLERTKT